MPEQRVAVITGSTRGIGFAIAQQLAREEMQVVLNASSEKGLADAVAGLPGGSGRHCGIAADVRRWDQVSAMAAKVRERFGRCDLLVNNAGFTRFIPHDHLEDLTEEIFDQTLDVNLKGPYLCTRAFAPLLRLHPPGLIVNIASLAARTAVGSSVAYCASKAGLVTMTQALARALAPEIRVNSISPGLVDTLLTRDFGDYRGESIQRTPLSRLATVEEIARAVWVLDRQLTFVTGENLVVDGGRSLC